MTSNTHPKLNSTVPDWIVKMPLLETFDYPLQNTHWHDCCVYGLSRPVTYQYVTCEEEPRARMTVMTMRMRMRLVMKMRTMIMVMMMLRMARMVRMVRMMMMMMLMMMMMMNDDDDDDDDDGAGGDDDEDGVVMWWCRSKLKFSEGKDRLDRKAEVESLEFLAFRVGMGLFFFASTELAYPMCLKVMLRSNLCVVKNLQKAWKFADRYLPGSHCIPRKLLRFSI